MNASYPLVLQWLSKASIGLSTMVDEHFGINIVELMVCMRPFVIMNFDKDRYRLLASFLSLTHRADP